MRRGLGGGKFLALQKKKVDGGAHVKEDEEEDDGDTGEVWRLLCIHITLFFFFFHICKRSFISFIKGVQTKFALNIKQGFTKGISKSL